MEFKLVDIPEMGYTSKDVDASGKSMPRGEICTRGNGVCAGYYKQKDKVNNNYNYMGGRGEDNE